MSTTTQPTLFDPTAAPSQPPALPYQAAPPAAYSAALAGDGLDWLGALLPPPRPLVCPQCRRPMRLPAVPLLWQCPICDTGAERSTT